jgi:hypothetical protein
MMLHLSDRKCQVCNSPHNPEVHHRTYKRLGDERPNDLIVLCSDCHAVFHGRIGAFNASSCRDCEHFIKDADNPACGLVGEDCPYAS